MGKKIRLINEWLKRVGTRFVISKEKISYWEQGDEYGVLYRLDYINPSGRISDVYTDVYLYNCIRYAVEVLRVPIDRKFDKDLENNIGLTLRDAKKINFSRPSRDIRKMISHYLPFRG